MNRTTKSKVEQIVSKLKQLASDFSTYVEESYNEALQLSENNPSTTQEEVADLYKKLTEKDPAFKQFCDAALAYLGY